MSKYKDMPLFKTKKWKYILNKSDLWQVITLLTIGIVPLLISTFNYFSPLISLILSGIFFILLILISLYVFVERLTNKEQS